ncbi:MAG: NAD(P)-dependent oxidoreductase [Bacteriovorax sp.]|nr:NAD(P)-dependent oxidoreductase [Bacteriovorax sp.]
MKKGKFSKFTVKRISSSPYFSSDFSKLEQETIINLTAADMLPLNSPELTSILITNTHTDVSSITQEQLEICQLMIHPNSGYDNFPSNFISKVNFPVVIGNPIRANAVASFILSALLSHYSPIPNEATWSESRKWPRKLLAELNILILGHGHIGRLLSESLAPLARVVRIYDPYAGFPDLDLQNIDVLIPACSLNKKNQHLIDEAMLLKLNEDFLLINAARGSLVNTKDLLSVLLKRPSAFAVLDVFEKEPADFNQLFKETKNIKFSSHIAGVYKKIDINTANFEAQVISDFIKLDVIEFEIKYKTMLLKNRLLSPDFLI